MWTGCVGVKIEVKDGGRRTLVREIGKQTTRSPDLRMGPLFGLLVVPGRM